MEAAGTEATEAGEQRAACLGDLPAECLLCIAEQLPLHDLRSFFQLCKHTSSLKQPHLKAQLEARWLWVHGPLAGRKNRRMLRGAFERLGHYRLDHLPWLQQAASGHVARLWQHAPGLAHWVATSSAAAGLVEPAAWSLGLRAEQQAGLASSQFKQAGEGGGKEPAMWPYLQTLRTRCVLCTRAWHATFNSSGSASPVITPPHTMPTRSYKPC